jgi:cobalamin biosynthesis protein CobD/CbiB
METRRRKVRPTQHQRQVRFLGGLFLVVMTLATILLFWFMNRLNFRGH